MILALRGLWELLEFGFKVFKVLTTAMSRTRFTLMAHSNPLRISKPRILSPT